jgi:hypothetical protein
MNNGMVQKIGLLLRFVIPSFGVLFEWLVEFVMWSS